MATNEAPQRIRELRNQANYDFGETNFICELTHTASSALAVQMISALALARKADLSLNLLFEFVPVW